MYLQGNVVINGNLSVRGTEGQETFGVSQEGYSNVGFGSSSTSATLDVGIQGSTGIQGIQNISNETLNLRNTVDNLQEQLDTSKKQNEELKREKKRMIECLKTLHEHKFDNEKMSNWVKDILDEYNGKNKKIKSRYKFINKK